MYKSQFTKSLERLKLIQWQGKAKTFSDAGGLMAVGQFVRASGVVVANNRDYATIEIDRLQSRLGRMRHRVWSWSEALSPLRGTYDLVMLTLTYAGVNDWRPNHIRDFMLTLRSRFPWIVCYALVAELQERGAVHYHVLVGVPLGAEFYTAKGYGDKSARSGIGYPDALGDWVHGSTRSEVAKHEFYIVTYSGKEYQKNRKFPKGLRMFAVWISSRLLSPAQVYRFRLSALPHWLQSIVSASPDVVSSRLKITRSVGGGWQVGEWLTLPSPYQIVLPRRGRRASGNIKNVSPGLYAV